MRNWFVLLVMVFLGLGCAGRQKAAVDPLLHGVHYRSISYAEEATEQDLFLVVRAGFQIFERELENLEEDFRRNEGLFARFRELFYRFEQQKTRGEIFPVVGGFQTQEDFQAALENITAFGDFLIGRVQNIRLIVQDLRTKRALIARALENWEALSPNARNNVREALEQSFGALPEIFMLIAEMVQAQENILPALEGVFY